MQTHAHRGTALLLGIVLALPVIAVAQTTGTQSAAQQAQATRSGSSTGTRGEQSDSNDWQQAGKTDTQADEENASQPAATTGDDFDTLDTDHDGRISRSESGASQDFSGRFKTLDTDGDGYVSNSEYRKGVRATRTPTATP
jgi:hypothetical protein